MSEAEAFDVRTYVEANLSRAQDSSGSEITAVCPFCDKWGGFYVNADNGNYVCFKCGAKNKSIVWLVAQVEGISTSDAVAYIFKRTIKLRRKSDIFTLADRIRGIRPSEREGAGDTDRIDVPLPKQFKPCWDGKSWRLPGYLSERRIKSKTAADWGLGFCRTGDYAGRLIIPIDCPNGTSFTARDMTGDQIPKYMNPTGADHGKLLIGWHVADLSGDLAIVEGPLDAVRFYQHGIPALAVGGKVLHADQMAMLSKLSPTQSVTVCLDPEELVAPYAVAKQLIVHFENVHIAKLPDGMDPGDSTRSAAERAMEDAPRYRGDRVTGLKSKLEALKRRG